MKPPKNFYKIDERGFISHSGNEFWIETHSHDPNGIWLIPKSEGYTHVTLIRIDWENGLAHLSFPVAGMGEVVKLPLTADETITPSDIQTRDHFIDWCRNVLHKYESNLRK